MFFKLKNYRTSDSSSSGSSSGSSSINSNDSVESVVSASKMEETKGSDLKPSPSPSIKVCNSRKGQRTNICIAESSSQ